MLKLATCKICLKVLTDPTRLSILEYLNNKPAMTVNELVSHFHLRQPTISHHLKELKKSRFVDTKKSGTFIAYSLNKMCKRNPDTPCWLLENNFSASVTT
ncbi:MAG: metalloregulator ArsR/SmtB family transcription factor [Patescibacteria group bacterium]